MRRMIWLLTWWDEGYTVAGLLARMQGEATVDDIVAALRAAGISQIAIRNRM